MPTAYPLLEQFEGIYEVPEVAQYIFSAEHTKYEVGLAKIASDERRRPFYKVTSRHILRWLRNGLAHQRLSDVPGQSLLLTFEDMVSMRVIAALRAAGASFHLIYKTEDWLRTNVGYPRPFAVEQLWTLPTHPRNMSKDEADRADIFARLRSQLVKASGAGQLAFEFFQDYILPVHGLTFKDEVAVTWEAAESILLDPEIQFGAPCIKGTRIPTRTIWGMIAAGDTRDYVARSFRISQGDVAAAIQWEESLAVR